jgi:hypothetical protein
LLAVWPVGIGHTAEVVAVADRLPIEHAHGLCYRLTCLSECLWDAYARPVSSVEHGDLEELWRREDERASFELVFAALRMPSLPDEQGVLEVPDAAIGAYAEALGRLLQAIADDGLTEAVTAEVGREMRAVERAERGDFSGRAAQGVVLDRLDVSPAQVAIAERMLWENPLGPAELLTSVDAAAACVAAARWLAAAATVVAEASELAAADVFGAAGRLRRASTTVPALVVQGVLVDGRSPHRVVHALLSEAVSAKEGRIPDLVGLLDKISTVRRLVRQVPPELRNEALADLLPLRSTPLDPTRPARDLLEHLLDGVRSCLVVLAQHAGIGNRSADPDPVLDEFVARVRQVATERPVPE